MDDPIECPRCNGKAIRESEWADHQRWHDGGERIVDDPERWRKLNERMMPGQTPYTPEEVGMLHELVSDAAKGDPGEAGEIEDRAPR